MASNGRFEVYRDRQGAWRWRRRLSDGTVIGAACEGFPDRATCEANMTRGVMPIDKWEFYKDKRGAMRWRRMAPNGKVIGASTQGFRDRLSAEENARLQGFRPLPTR
ncbi:MAG: hypothetical protein AAFS07_03105 [Pseudomonadota bacterium]